METTCESLLSELQKIWDEVGEPDSEKDKMLLELEQECLDAYRRKVDQAIYHRAQLHKATAEAEAELAYIYSAMGEQPLHPSQNSGSLKEELKAVKSQLEEMRKRKIERRDRFVEVLNQIKDIANEISSYAEDKFCMVVNENDLSLNKLEDFCTQLQTLQKEKSDRLKLVMENLTKLNSLCVVLGLDFKQTVSRIHHSLDESTGQIDISIETMERLSYEIQRLKELKQQRLRQLQDLATNMVEHWALLDISTEEQFMFQNVTKNLTISENEIMEPNTLSLDFIRNAETEVSRLEQMKSSRMMDVILKKRSILEELCKKAHMVVEAQCVGDYSVEAVESGMLDLPCVLEQVEKQISKVKEEASSRKDILEKVEKWLAACEEEMWLEEYNKDDNRYNAGRGTHLILKHAEKARVAVSKIPALLQGLTSKAMAWEKERGVDFSYDGVSLLSMLKKYTILKQEKERDRQRKRDEKKLHGQLLTEQEVLFGSKQSPSNSGKKVVRSSIGGEVSRRLSLGGPMLKNLKPESAALASRQLKKSNLAKLKNRQAEFQNDSPADLSSGKRVSGHNSKQSPKMRKPLSPLNSALSPKANAGNLLHHHKTENLAFHRTVSNSITPIESPAKMSGSVDDKNRTPRTLPMVVPTPPSKAAVLMQTTDNLDVAPGVEDFEYSFEERRASFALPKSYLKSLLHL